MKRLTVLFLLTLVATFYSKVFAQKPAIVTSNEPGWHHIGHTSASFKQQNESISVLGADEFTALKVKVSDAGLDVDRLQVFYESGDMENINVADDFLSAGESKTIPLKYPGKDIQKVAFTYKTKPNAKGEKAEIDLYGLKTNQPTGRDSYKDEKKEMKEEASETHDEMKQDARETENKVEQDAQSAGDKIEKGAKDAAAAITDQKLKTKVGPDGETAYVDDNGKYYIINNAGEKQFITEAQLKDKPDQK